MDIFAWLNDQLLRMNWLSELVRLLVEKVIVTPTNLELRLHPLGIGALAAESRPVAEGAGA